MPDHSTSAVAYSYIRFSTGEQAKGDSLRRQTEKAEAYCQRKGLALDERLTLRDLGVSAYRGDNALVGNLGVFLEAIKRKTVLPGSVLIVESVDRISRQGIDEGYDIIKTILKAGVLLVTLSPEREFGADAVKSLSKGALELQLILERAAEESERKSERVGAAWTRKKAAARGGKVMSKRLPAWVRNDGGKLVLIPEAAAAVREVFRLALSGYGIPAIIKTLTANGVPAIGTTGRWTRAYLSLLLRDRRVLGEYQPRRGKATDGEVIANYYPAMLTEEQWRDLRNCIGQRRRNSGRPGKAQVNIFKGLLRHARDGDSYIMSQRFSRSPGKPTRKYAVLVNSEGDQGRARLYSIPYDGLENAVLTALREID
ncbi:MAG TPA: recombinase family protein, partial [Gemmataceae bacterium]|nr:recombinase family protein [Gemmataceae bacterium]